MMQDLLPSGRFAQLARLTRKALRVYANDGLLRPVHTDAHSGYNYYSLSQLDEARRIGHLRALGMSLEDIRTTLRAWNTPAVRAHLIRHRQQLEQQTAALRVAMRELDALLQAEQPSYVVQTKCVVPQRCVAVRQQIAPRDACAFIDASGPRLLQSLRTAYLQPAGALVVRYHESHEDDQWDIEACLPFAGAVYAPLPHDVAEVCLPGGTVVWTVHTGDYDGACGLQAAYEAVWSWVRDHGHDTIGLPYEVYLFDGSNTVDPADYRTEIGWLIA